MKASSIQIGKPYQVAVGRGITIVTVIGTNPKTAAWVCETQGGKEMTIGDASRFIKAISGGKEAKKGKGGPKAEHVPEAALCPTERPQKRKPKPVADQESIAQLTDAFKEADR